MHWSVWVAFEQWWLEDTWVFSPGNMFQYLFQGPGFLKHDVHTLQIRKEIQGFFATKAAGELHKLHEEWRTLVS